MFPYKIEENLELRHVSERYAEDVFLVVKENLEHISEWMPWATKDYSIDSAKEFIKMNRNRYAENEITDFYIFFENKLVGIIGFNSPDFRNKSIEIGYWLAKNYNGKGIMTKCCKVLIDFAFDDLKLNRIGICCATENFKSQAIPERLGFTKEGTARQAEWLHEKFVDLIVYSMLKEEWKDI